MAEARRKCELPSLRGAGSHSAGIRVLGRPRCRHIPMPREAGRPKPGICRAMQFHEHHFRNLVRARDHLTETIVSLRSATDRMTGDDWIDATALLNEITEDIG